MDILKIELGRIVEGLKCPRCKTKKMKKTGRKSDKSFVECQECLFEQWVDSKNVEFYYEEPKENRKKKGNKEELEEE